MKHLFALAATAFAAVAFYAVTAPAGQQAVTPKQFAALTKRVTTLEKNYRTLGEVTNVLVACVVGSGQAVPVSAFGGGTEGYLYRLANGQQVLTTALDVVPQAQAASARSWMLITSPQCAQVINQATSVLPPMKAADLLRGAAKLDKLTKQG